MKMKKFVSALLAMSVLTGTLPAAAAADDPVPAVEYEVNGHQAGIKIVGIPEGRTIHSAQLELTVSGSVKAAEYAAGADDEAAYTVAKWENGTDENLVVTLYIDSVVPLSSGQTVSMGSLDFREGPSDIRFGSTGKLTLLDERQKRVYDDISVTVTQNGAVQPDPPVHPPVNPESPGDLNKPSDSDSDDTGSSTSSSAVSRPRGSGVAAKTPGSSAATPSSGANAPDTANTTNTPASSSAAAVFADVAESDWYGSAVDYVYSKGMMSGTSAGTFSPNTATSRAMIVSILHRLEGSPAADGGTFPDVAAGQYYTGAVSWAASNGIVSGYSNGRFQPNDGITREQLAAILYRYAQYKGYDTSGSADLSTFSDASMVSEYAAGAMRWAVSQGLITGTNRGTLDPSGGATRAQAASILMRFCENAAK